MLRDLFLKILSILEKGELASREAVESIEKKKAAIVSILEKQKTKKAMENLFQFMSPRYLLYSNTNEILEHFELYSRMGDAEFVWDV